MKTLIEKTKRQITALKRACQSVGLLQMETIRHTTCANLEQLSPREADAFGLWKHTKAQFEDGLELQKRVREEW